MVWLDNSSGTTVTVSVSSVHTPGGATGFFPVESGLGSYATNHWQRNAASSETAVVRLGNITVKIPDVNGNDYLLIYRDAFIKVPTSAQVFFG